MRAYLLVLVLVPNGLVGGPVGFPMNLRSLRIDEKGWIAHKSKHRETMQCFSIQEEGIGHINPQLRLHVTKDLWKTVCA